MENKEHRLLGIDYGEKRIGLSITDPLNIFAYPLTTLKNDSKIWSNLKEVILNYDVKEIVLGYPIREDGKKSTSTLKVEDFKKKLENKIKLPVHLVDESYSSVIATQIIRKSVSSKKKRRSKELIDKYSASIILQDYLDGIK